MKHKTRKKHALFKDIVFRFARESHCLSKQVCSMAVKDNRIVATGINGTPSGQENCDDHFKKYYKKHHIKLSFDEWIKTKEFKDLHHEWSNQHEVHGEQSLISWAASHNVNLEGCDFYITLEPCMTCMKLLAALKPANIYFFTEYERNDVRAVKFFKDCGINCEFLDI